MTSAVFGLPNYYYTKNDTSKIIVFKIRHFIFIEMQILIITKL